MQNFTTTIRPFVGTCFSLAVLTLLSACGSSGDGDGGTTVSSEIYNGPGSKWDITLNSDGSFHIDHRPDVNTVVDYTVDGDYERHTSGFVTLTVTGGEGADSPAAGSQAWALEVPGYAFMLKPVDGDQLIAMVTSGNCPVADFDANWVIVKHDVSSGSARANDASRDFAGTFHYDSATGVPTLPIKKALSNGFPTVTGGGIGSGTVACVDGIMNIPDAVMYLTQNGGAIVHTDGGTPSDNQDDSFIFGLGQNALTSLSALDDDYAGMLFDDNMSNGSKLQPVNLSCVSGSCTGTVVTDVTTGVTSSETVTITLSNTINEIGGTAVDGFLTGSIIDSSSNVGNMTCMADPDAIGTGKKIISCVGQSPGNTNDLFNVLFVSK